MKNLPWEPSITGCHGRFYIRSTSSPTPSQPAALSDKYCCEGRRSGLLPGISGLSLIHILEASTFYEKTGNGEHDSCMAGWVANAEPDNTYRPLFTSVNAGAGGNRSFYRNPEVDALVDDAAINRDKDAVAKDYQTVLQTLSDDAVWLPLYLSLIHI